MSLSCVRGVSDLCPLNQDQDPVLLPNINVFQSNTFFNVETLPPADAVKVEFKSLDLKPQELD